MSRLTFSPLAAADIDNIWDYTVENWGLDQADQYADDIRDICNDLANGDKRGRDVDVRDGYLKCSAITPQTPLTARIMTAFCPSGLPPTIILPRKPNPRIAGIIVSQKAHDCSELR